MPEHRVKIFKFSEWSLMYEQMYCGWDWRCTCGRTSLSWYTFWEDCRDMALDHLREASHD